MIHARGLSALKTRSFIARRLARPCGVRLFSLKNEEEVKPGSLKNFVTNIIDGDLRSNKTGGRVVTRFPPEPNGYLHLGHAKSINFNFGVASAYSGVTHMRFDDTNPAKEDMEYVHSILEDVRWLVTGSTQPEADPWFGEVRYASSYFGTIYEAAEYLIEQGLAYVDDLSAEEMREYRGTLTQAGRNSPFRDRSIAENLMLFRKMRSGELKDGTCTLRAKMDMSSGNMNLRDPALYRIKQEAHPVTGSEWCIYPMYDFAHAISDALEGITHSLCTLEFDNHRALYDWIVDSLSPSGLLPYQKESWRPRQYEFSRLNVQYTVLSKRKLIQLVTEGHVLGWDDPRMPTICALRRRGYPAAAVRLFCERVGISKVENNIELTVLEDCAREVLDGQAPRIFAIASPLKVTLTNWAAPESAPEVFTAEQHPKRPELGYRELPFTGSLYIDREDFFDTGAEGLLAPPKGYKRLLPGGQVRLKYAYVITCDEVVRDARGQAVELRCSYDAATRAGATPEGQKKVRGIVQWVSQSHAVPADLYQYDRLFSQPSPGKEHEGDFLQDLNPHSLSVLEGAVAEPSVLSALPGETYQFERVGYFCLDARNNLPPLSRDGPALRFNRVVTLKDTWGAEKGEETGVKNSEGGSQKGPQQKQGDQAAVEDIRRVEMRVGRILSVERHPDADGLFVEQVDCGDATGPRTIISGLVRYMAAEELMGRRVVVLCNLKPSKMRGIISEGMLLAASVPKQGGEEGEEVVELLDPPADAPVGELISVSGFDASQPDDVLKSKSAMEVWKRVAAELATNDLKQASFGAAGLLMTSAGPCTVASLAKAPIR